MALVAIVASITSIRNWYAYDDVSLILFNPATHSLSALVRVWGQPYWPPGGGTIYGVGESVVVGQVVGIADEKGAAKRR